MLHSGHNKAMPYCLHRPFMTCLYEAQVTAVGQNVNSLSRKVWLARTVVSVALQKVTGTA